MGCCLSCRKRRLQPKSESSMTATLIDSMLEPKVSEPDLKFTKRPQDEEGKPWTSGWPHHTPCFSNSLVPVHEDEELVITSIMGTDVTLGPKCRPSSYVVVEHSSHEWKTEDKPLAMDGGVVRWDSPIPIPSNLSATISFSIYGSSGLQELLWKLIVTVEQVVSHGENSAPFILFPKDGDVVSLCSFLFVTVERRKRENSKSLLSAISAPDCQSTAVSGDQLEDAMNRGRATLLRYQKHRQKEDLERSIGHFEHVLNICPLDHPYHAVAQSHLAMSQFIHSWFNGTDPSSSVPHTCHDGPTGHHNQPSVLIQPSTMRSKRAKKRRDIFDLIATDCLLQEGIIKVTDSHENPVITVPRLLSGPVQADSQSSIGRDFPWSSIDEDAFTLSVQLLGDFERSGDLPSLQQTITLLEPLLHSTPVSDHRYLVGKLTLGVALLCRFQHLGNPSDLEQSISRLTDAVDLASDGHCDKSICLGSLGTSLHTRFNYIGELKDLERAISSLWEAAQLTSDGYPSKPQFLNDLGNSLLSRFKRVGELDDLEQAISKLKDAIDLIQDGHPAKSSCSTNLGNALLARFERTGELGDLDQAISMHGIGVELCASDDPRRPGRLNNLANSLLSRFDHLHELRDLEEAISSLKVAINLIPDSHMDKPVCMGSLGTSLMTRFEHSKELCDLDQAISWQREAVNLTLDGCPDKSRHSSNLGTALMARFRLLGEKNDLDQATARFKEAADLTPNGAVDKPTYLSSAGDSLLTRFHRQGNLSDLEEAICRLTHAVQLVPDGHPHKTTYLSELGGSFQARFEHTGSLGDLEKAISILSDVLRSFPNSPDVPAYLGDLGNALFIRFNHLGKLSDLEEAVERLSAAIHLTPDGHPHKDTFLTNLGNCINARFERTGELGDLEQAISMFSDAVDLCPKSHDSKPGCLNNLGNAFLARFRRLEELSDLEQAISTLRVAIDLTPNGHRSIPVRLTNLGASLLARFDYLNEQNDLEGAISSFKDAFDLTPDGNPDKPDYLGNLGNSFKVRFQHFGELTDLEQALSMHANAVDLIPDGHPNKAGHLNNLGSCLFNHYQSFNESSTLDQAISRLGDAVDLTPDGIPDKLIRLSNLSSCFTARFDHLGNPNDLEQAISMLKEVVRLTPDGHPAKPNYLLGLARYFLVRFMQFHDLHDFEHAALLSSSAACASTGPITTRLNASKMWISCAGALQHQSLLHAYSVAIDLLPQLAWTGLPLLHRYRVLKQGENVVREAAAAALELGHPELAVEWLEQGRAIVWGELFQLRSSYEELSSLHPDHARRLRELSVALERASTIREKLLSKPNPNAKQRESESLEQEAVRLRLLAVKRDQLIQEIRQLSGFDRFLLGQEFSQLRVSAQSGPVVILNAAESRCDALIILAEAESIIHVPISNFTLKRSKGLQNMMRNLLGRARAVSGDEREGRPVTRNWANWESLLSTLWNDIVKPVLNALNFLTPGTTPDLPRIFWCPTGPFAFLPIHAAGLYGTRHSQPGHKLSDFAISSYTPTLSILASLSLSEVISSEDLHFLTVRQPPSDGQSRLPGVDIELEYIKAVILNSPSSRTTLTESCVGTVEEVLSLMGQADWIHFACHGIQDETNPTDSGLCLADRRRLKLSDIVALSRPRGGLAFLSACQTATGDTDLSDEAIHLAAGMLFAGYGGVVGTMWSISDRLAPTVAKDVYGKLFENNARPDYREAARALQDAVGRLRDGGASFVEWLPFIHVGL